VRILCSGTSSLLMFPPVFCLILARCLLLPLDREDGGSTFSRNIGKLIPHYMASHPSLLSFTQAPATGPTPKRINQPISVKSVLTLYSRLT
jgi:hypothetical protein